MRQDGKFYTGNEVVATLDTAVEEGDVIGIAYDHVDLSFYKNGEPLHVALSGVKSQVYPVVYVDDGAILDVQFSSFWFTPPKGFEEIMVEQTIL
uniref:SPRY domain-containing protein n=1 Tax=Plectus sambesii TaxID=2011161 RepID=A0A914WGG8_9BILA